MVCARRTRRRATSAGKGTRTSAARMSTRASFKPLTAGLTKGPSATESGKWLLNKVLIAERYG